MTESTISKKMIGRPPGAVFSQHLNGELAMPSHFTRRLFLGAAAALPASAAAANGALHSHSCPDLAARFADLYLRYMQEWEHDEKEKAIFAVNPEYKSEDPDCENWTALNAETVELAGLILSEPALTFADLILQARVCALENNNFWTDPMSIEFMDFGELSYRRLVDRICEFGGLVPFPGVSVLPAPAPAGGEA